MVRWSLIEEWLQLRDSRTRTHILAWVLFQATLLPRLIWLIARICSRETTVGEVLVLTVGPFAVCATPKAIALDHVAQS